MRKPADTGNRCFDQFWAAYPRKGGKEKAKRAFEKIQPSETELQQMLAELERCFNGIGILAGGKWTESNPCEPGNKFVSGVTEEYPVRWGEQLGQDTSFGDASFGDTSFRRAS